MCLHSRGCCPPDSFDSSSGFLINCIINSSSLPIWGLIPSPDKVPRPGPTLSYPEPVYSVPLDLTKGGFINEGSKENWKTRTFSPGREGWFPIVRLEWTSSTSPGRGYSVVCGRNGVLDTMRGGTMMWLFIPIQYYINPKGRNVSYRWDGTTKEIYKIKGKVTHDTVKDQKRGVNRSDKGDGRIECARGPRERSDESGHNSFSEGFSHVRGGQWKYK